MGKRRRYEAANMRGGLGVRKRLSEESLRDSYRLNGVPTGSAVARCLDKYGRWQGGFVIGVIVRKTASIVQVRWEDQNDIQTYNSGDARYEVDRNRWKILGQVRGNPLDPDNPIAATLKKLREEVSCQLTSSSWSGRIPHAAPNDQGGTTTEEDEHMAKEMSNAAAERAAAQKMLDNGDLKERETYTAKQVATRCGTDAKTMRKFFRSSHSTVEPVGQGGRYEFDAKDFPKIKREFEAWQNKAKTRATPTPKPAVPITEVMDKAKEIYENDIPMERVADAIERAQSQSDVDEMAEAIQKAVDQGVFDDDKEPSPEELAELEDMDLDLDEDGDN